MQTERYTLTIDFSNAEATIDMEAKLPSLVMAAMMICANTYEKGYPHITFVATVGLCGSQNGPNTGELVVVFTGERHPDYVSDPNSYQTAWEMLGVNLMEVTKTEHATLVRQEVDLLVL